MAEVPSPHSKNPEGEPADIHEAERQVGKGPRVADLLSAVQDVLPEDDLEQIRQATDALEDEEAMGVALGMVWGELSEEGIDPEEFLRERGIIE